MARFLGMNAFAPTGILRFQIRQRLKKLRSEDKEIMWEGTETLSAKELKQDLRDRGLPTAALDGRGMRTALDNWLALSQKKEIPYTLLILMNMLKFADQRTEQKELKATQVAASEAAAAAHAAQQQRASASAASEESASRYVSRRMLSYA